ncbi:hypothetical protein GCM10026982_21170 [Nocardiopsis aegyptia]
MGEAEVEASPGAAEEEGASPGVLVSSLEVLTAPNYRAALPASEAGNPLSVATFGHTVITPVKTITDACFLVCPVSLSSP